MVQFLRAISKCLIPSKWATVVLYDGPLQAVVPERWMCFYYFGRFVYKTKTKRFESDTDDSFIVRRSVGAPPRQQDFKTVLFRTKRKMADGKQGIAPKRVTRQTVKLGLTLDPKPVPVSAPQEATRRRGFKIPGSGSHSGSVPEEQGSSVILDDPSPVPTLIDKLVSDCSLLTGEKGTSTGAPADHLLTGDPALGGVDSLKVIQGVVPLDTSQMEVDHDDQATTPDANPPPTPDPRVSALLTPGATLTKELCDFIMQAFQQQAVAASSASKAASRRIPTFPIDQPGPSRVYTNAAMSPYQQQAEGLHHVDSRVASAVARARVPHRLSCAVAAPPSAPSAPGFVPVPGPEFTNQTPAQIDSSGKVGNESVYLRDIVSTSVRASQERSQDIISRIVEWYGGNQGAVADEGEQVTLIDTIALPQMSGTAPQAQCLEHFVRSVEPQEPLRVTHIYWDNYLESARVPEAARGAFMSAGNPESKTIVSQLRAKADVSNGMANRLCTRLYDATSQYALEGLFFVLFFMADYKFTAEQMEIPVALQAAAEGAMTLINLAADGEALPLALAAAEEAIVTKRICFNRTHLSSTHINVLRMASRGPTAFAGDDIGQMIHSYFRMPQINFALYDAAPIAPSALATPTAQQIWSSAFHFAQLQHAEVDLVRGWVRAQATVNGKHYIDEDRRGPYYMATLELEALSMPKPVGRNFLWDFFCDRFEQIDVLLGADQEYNTLATLTMANSRCPGAILAGLVSIGVSTYLTYFNIGGREMNNWANANDATVSRFLATAMSARSNNIPPIFQCMVSNITACTGFILSPTCFRTRAYSVGFVGRAMEDDDGWDAIWGRRVPYLIRVICMAWLYSAWHTVWGLSGPYPGIHIGSELFSTLPDGMRMICMHLGDDSYHKMAQSSTPFVYIYYGLHFMNIYRQSSRVNELARIKYITITRAQSGALAYGNVLVDDDEMQPLYDPATFSIIEGTLPSYDWATGQVLAPVLTAPSWPDMHYNAMLAMGNRDAAMAGFPVRRDVRFVAVRRDNIDISVALGLTGGQAAMNAARPDAPANEGN